MTIKRSSAATTVAFALIMSGCGSQTSDAGQITSRASSTVTAPPQADTTGSLATIQDAFPDPGTLPLPESAAALADALAEAEQAIRDPSMSDIDASAWGWRQQQLYRVLAESPDWADTAVDLEDPGLAEAAALNWDAQQHLAKLGASHATPTQFPAWRIDPPAPTAELMRYYRDGEEKWGIDWTYLAAINLVETRMGRIVGLSTAGAVGPMQFLPTTWAECCEGDPTDPADAIVGAARYLTIRGGPDDMERALWGYNNSDHYVGAVTAYATAMQKDPAAYRGYHGWEVLYRSSEGLAHLPVGYEETEAVPAADWLAEHPDSKLFGE